MDYSALKAFIEESIPWVKAGGLTAELLEERHIILKIPKERHVNHVGTVYAGSTFMLMEIAGAALAASTYGLGRFIPLNKEMTIRYKKPATTDIFCELTISEEEAAEKIKPIEEKGKGIWPLEMEAKDETGVVVATSSCNYYLKKIG